MAKYGFISSSAITGTRKKIICVDDMSVSLMSLKRGLNAHYEVYLAESTDKMYKILENVMPDLIILDVNMPETSGYDAIKNLKNDKRYAEIPVMFLTCNSDKESVVKGLSLGAVDYLVKPFDAAKLLESINNQFNHKVSKITAENNEFNFNILVVDDMASMLRTIHHALHGKYNVFMLSKSDLVINFLQNNKPDLILLDYLMPGMSGFDLIPKIRELADFKDIPIIIITTEGTVKNVNDAVSRGASDFIVKPFDPKELTFKIEKHIRMRKEKRENNEIAFLMDYIKKE